MYTRSDDPKDLPHKNLIALVVLLVIGVLGALLVMFCWNLAQHNSRMGSSDIAEALQTAAGASSVEDIAAERGLSATGDSVTTVMFAIMGEGEDGSEQLAALNLAVLNETQGFAKLLQIPVDASVTGKGITETFAGWYSAGGVESLAMRIASAGVPVNHIVVMTAAGWESFMTVASQGSSALTSNAADLLKSIEESDMDITALIDIMTRAMAAGLSSESFETIGTSEVTTEAGGTLYMIDETQIATAAGTMA